MVPVSDLKKYRLAKKLVSDLEAISVIMKQIKKDLKEYRHYYPVKNTLENLIRNSEILEVKLKIQKQIVSNKGSIDNGIEATTKTQG